MTGEETMQGPITLNIPAFKFTHTCTVEQSERVYVYEEVRQGRAGGVREYFEKLLERVALSEK